VEGLSFMEAAEKVCAAVKRLCDDLHVPKLGELGIEKGKFEEAIPEMVEEAMNSPLSMINARKPKQEDLVEIYRMCY